jgi:AraC family transcriptional regulator of adaptative response/methylated-DNA-[protein]-cysteine methyltransferase
MNTNSTTRAVDDYERIAHAITFIEKNFRRQPGLDEIAASVHLSEHHFQRLFSRWVGISPKRFLQYLTKEYAKKVMEKSRSLLEVTFEAGLSSPGRLHELFVTCEAMTPGEYKSEGQGLVIFYGFHPTPFGECLLAATARGICALYFVKKDRKQTLALLREKWRRAELQHDPQKTQPYVARIFYPSPKKKQPPLHLLVSGTNFQIKVWEALLHIPRGARVSYADLARYLGAPQAARAVGNAVAHNAITYLIPCHRVVRKAGELGGYSGGATRKKVLLAWEAAKAEERLD